MMKKSASSHKQVTVITLSGEKGSVMICDHVNQVREWGNTLDGEYGPSLWGCKNCDETSVERLATQEIKSGSSQGREVKQ